MSQWNDFNDAEQQQSSFDLIPKNTEVKVRMTLIPGGYSDPAQGWTHGWATQSENTSSVYLSAEFVVLEGPFAKRKFWSLIGLYSSKGPEWTNMGRSLIRAALNSARNIHPDDNGPQAQAARQIAQFGDLDGLVFAARVDIEKDSRGDDRNTLRQVIEPGHKAYLGVMKSNAVINGTLVNPSAGAKPVASGPLPTGKPGWAQ